MLTSRGGGAKRRGGEGGEKGGAQVVWMGVLHLEATAGNQCVGWDRRAFNDCLHSSSPGADFPKLLVRRRQGKCCSWAARTAQAPAGNKVSK